MPRRSFQLPAETTVAANSKPVRDFRVEDSGAYSISEFCFRNKIGESSYFYLKAIGRAPKTTRVGRRVIIFSQDETAWRQSIQDTPLPASLRRAAEAAAEKEAA